MGDEPEEKRARVDTGYVKGVRTEKSSLTLAIVLKLSLSLSLSLNS